MQCLSDEEELHILKVASDKKVTYLKEELDIFKKKQVLQRRNLISLRGF